MRCIIIQNLFFTCIYKNMFPNRIGSHEEIIQIPWFDSVEWDKKDTEQFAIASDKKQSFISTPDRALSSGVENITSVVQEIVQEIGDPREITGIFLHGICLHFA